MATNNTWNSNVPIGVPLGGTGAATFTNNGVLIGNAANAISSAGAGTAGQILVSTGAGLTPSWITPTATAPLVVTANATTLNYGIPTSLTVAQSGTGLTSFTPYAPVLGNSSSSTGALRSLPFIAPAGQILGNVGTAAPNWTGKALVKISTVVAAGNPATVEFTSGISTTYAHYLLTYSGVRGTVNAQTFRGQVGTAGPTYITTGYYSLNINCLYSSNVPTTGNVTGNFTLSSNGAIVSSSGYVNGYAYLMNLSSASGSVSLLSQSFITFNNYQVYAMSSIACNSFVALKVYFTTGNIAAGTFTLYGIVS